MGVRELAASAVAAKEAADELENQQNQKRHGDAGVVLVEQRLGLVGKAVRASRLAPVGSEQWGDNTIVRVEDDDAPLFIRVTNQGKNRVPITFNLVTEPGGLFFTHPVARYAVYSTKAKTTIFKPCTLELPKFENLAELSKVLLTYDAFMNATDPETVGRHMYEEGADRIVMGD